MLPMPHPTSPSRSHEIYRWLAATATMVAVVAVYRLWVHVNPTTVALTLLLLILLVAARWTLRLAVVLSVAAAACYNFFFLPPVDTFTIADPQNWLALSAFLATSVIGSNLSQRARNEATAASDREREVALLFALSRELLQTDNVAALVHALPRLVQTVAGAEAVWLYLQHDDALHCAGSAPERDKQLFRERAQHLLAPLAAEAGETWLPLRSGVRPRGLLVLRGVGLSSESFLAIGGLVSIALDRAQALEDVAHGEAKEESERLRTLILDSITHELRTPLTSIKGAASTLLAAEHIGAEDRQELITIIDEESDRLNRLIGQAVEMAQLDTREVHMTIAPEDVAAMVAEAREHCASALALHPVVATLPALPAIAADRTMIVKVLCNLLANAAKYSPPGSTIRIEGEQLGSFVLISVTDSGVGIDRAEHTLIFDRFYRSPAQSGSTSGTGMGLAISRAMVTAHGGELLVESRAGAGSCFTMTLPVSTSRA